MNGNHQNFDNVEILWRPKGADTRKQRRRFVDILEKKYNVKIGNYWDFHKWSVEHVEEFWTELWNFSEIIHSKKFEKVINLSVAMSEMPIWFEGAKLNFAENLLRIRDGRTALIMTGEDREIKKMTYAEVYDTAKIYAAAFRKLGIKKGDRVACYMSNREEPVFAMLGAVSIGAIWTGTLPLYGAEATLSRFKVVNPKVLITVDRFPNNGEQVEMLSKVRNIVAELESLEKVIIVPSKEESTLKDISGIRNSCFLDEFLQLGLERDGSIPAFDFEQVSLSHPIFISYTSGTTGLPKPLVHGSGILLEMAKVCCLCKDSGINSNFLQVSPVGWSTWNMTTLNLLGRSTVILYEGVPYFKSPTYLWDLIDNFQITNMFLTPGILDDLEKRNYVPRNKHSLESLAVIECGASVVKPNNYKFVYNMIKKDIIFYSGYGSTELMGSCMNFDPTLPIHEGEIPCAALGFDLDCIDESGRSVLGKIGELVIKKPIPSLPLGLWGDTDGSRFRETYFAKYKDKFALSDLGVINPVTKGIIIYCRSDESLNPKGERFGSSEIYNIVNLFPEIRDSLCVSQYSKNRNERVVLFVLLKEGHHFNHELVERIQCEIENGLSEEHVPELILETKDIPYTMTGKKMEILVKKIINNVPCNTETVKNLESLENFKNLPPYED